MKKTTQKKNYGVWIFLLVIILMYLSIFILNQEKTILIFTSFKKIFFQIIPVLLIVYLVLLLTNFYINNEILKKYMSENTGVKGWIIAILSGILSMGPLYMWYPLMKELQDKGVKNRFLVTFLYNRGIKLQWLPILIAYYGLKYSVTLLIVMAIISIPQGIITEKLIEKHQINKK